jgi:hypothetical protein
MWAGAGDWGHRGNKQLDCVVFLAVCMHGFNSYRFSKAQRLVSAGQERFGREKLCSQDLSTTNASLSTFKCTLLTAPTLHACKIN